MVTNNAPWQPSLLGLSPIAIDPSFRGAERLELGDGAWIDHLPGWCQGHSRLFETLRRTTRWKTSRRQMYDSVVDVPRLMASLPECGPGHRVLDEMAAALSGRYGVSFNRVGMNLYRDGADSVAWHGDYVLRDQEEDSFVATVSVGERRKFLLRPKHSNGPRRSLALSLGWGDLVVMGGSIQRTWEHAVPKVAHAGPRIAIMFRCGDYPG